MRDGKGRDRPVCEITDAQYRYCCMQVIVIMTLLEKLSSQKEQYLETEFRVIGEFNSSL